MEATEIDAFLSSLIDDLEVTAHRDGTGLGTLLTTPTPVTDDAALLALLATAVRFRNLGDTLLARTVGAVDRAGVAARRRDTVTNLLTAIGVPPAVARRAVKVARALRLLPGLADTTRDARLSGEHAAAVVTGLDHITARVPGLDDDTRADLVSSLLAQACCGTPGDVTTWARTTALGLAPQDAPVPVADNRELNEVTVCTGDDGRTHAELDLDVIAGEKLKVALDPLTIPVPQPDGSPDPRSARQRNADAFEKVLDAYLHGDHRPHSGGELPHVSITIPTTTCAHHSRGRGGDGESRRDVAAPETVARLDFGQPVSRDTAAMLLCDCDLTGFVVDADSVPIDIKKMARFFPPELRRALIIRDRGCAFPGCGADPAHTQAHHVDYWSNGGLTTIDNGCLLCQRHHTMVHHTDWQVRIGADRHPWFSPPPTRDDAPRTWLRSHARRTLTNQPTAAA